jgi:hypothetical protein
VWRQKAKASLAASRAGMVLIRSVRPIVASADRNIGTPAQTLRVRPCADKASSTMPRKSRLAIPAGAGRRHSVWARAFARAAHGRQQGDRTVLEDLRSLGCSIAEGAPKLVALTRIGNARRWRGWLLA